jgi:hypothetical protein
MLLKFLGNFMLWLILCGMTGWGALAIFFSDLPRSAGSLIAVIYALGQLTVLFFLRPRTLSFAVFFALFAIILAGYLAKKPSNHREWQADVAILPFADIDGDRVTVHNIRNCDYRSETDYTPRYYDQTFDVSKLETVDLYLVNWGIKYVSHTMLSFGFQGKKYLCISIETRKEKGEDYSTIKGFFRQYELIYVVADERDLVRLRTNYRKGETVYLYRLNGSKAVFRDIFLDYMRYINRLRNRPEWYNALTGNCTTQIRGHTRPYTGKTRWDWRILLNGWLDEMAYENGLLNQSLSLEALRKKSIINERAKKLDQNPDFSILIRQGLPGMETG